ncbi:hypothetical protein [Streptomyces sp. V1I6]|uniref:hypothetical protein n=1 Tax=Streptomyces sp. V1I6 TaxID=3042273 RepID=UPI0027D7B5C4|nr:hypothetical protein [Streptomyces sp. V1I6]
MTICVLAMPQSYERHTLPPPGGRLSGQLGGAFGVGGGDVAHGSVVAEPEQSHEVKGVGPLAGVEEDPALANLLHGESGAGEGLVEHAGADDWVVSSADCCEMIKCGLIAAGQRRCRSASQSAAGWWERSSSGRRVASGPNRW